MHNIYVVDQERNVAESILSMCMDITSKTNDNGKARRDLAMICNCPTLELNERGGKPRAPYCLKVKDRKNLKFPDGYAARLK
jgi:hypothetical protein